MLTFGEKENGKTYITRPAVYSVMFNSNKDKIAVIHVRSKDYFLPGGGIEQGETHEKCLEREVLEETGMKVKVRRFIGSAGRYFYSINEGTYYLSEGHFYECEAGEKIEEPVDEDHELRWVEPTEAVNCLIHDHQRWAVKKALSLVRP
ncbi:DNA mismatch repair protein MutT [Jeotgalibacillus malaysiensis]|uniref:DNA mismatch repair protein MutT n=1 Tax=Jeotgalibacillus malaysiensis TaxID=1508404 RepID=A0A0B5AQ84_9BACL|nr:NUDIX domain-containing protein [Jeotgalibacillus malaysiensis]AJD90244.1 DNA mismatch repair protein MutT [Jeotgalibacillus malaysiensis]